MRSGTSCSCNTRGGGQTKDDYPDLGELPGEEHRYWCGPRTDRCIAQGVENIYEIDTTRTVLNKATEITGKHYGDNEKDDVASGRVVADHSRTCVFMIADGVNPGNEGRGCVLRRITRRVINKMRAWCHGRSDVWPHRVRCGGNEPAVPLNSSATRRASRRSPR